MESCNESLQLQPANACVSSVVSACVFIVVARVSHVLVGRDHSNTYTVDVYV